MACRGVHFALTAEQASRLMDNPDFDDNELMTFVEEIEGAWDKDWLQETDKAWDAIHRCLTDGELEYGESPYHQCILGSENLYEGDDYIVNYLDPEEVKEVAAAIKAVDRKWLRRKYDAIDAETYQGVLGEDDFEYTWSWFQPLRDFFQKAAKHERAVLFSVDQ